MEDADKEKWKQIAERKMPKSKCPMCGGEEFILLDGFASTSVFKKADDDKPEEYFREVVFICHECGWVSRHVLQILEK